MWDVVVIILQLAGLAILLAAAAVSIGVVPEWIKRRMKGPRWG
jgi:hypothetical protein